MSSSIFPNFVVVSGAGNHVVNGVYQREEDNNNFQNNNVGRFNRYRKYNGKIVIISIFKSNECWNISIVPPPAGGTGGLGISSSGENNNTPDHQDYCFYCIEAKEDEDSSHSLPPVTGWKISSNNEGSDHSCPTICYENKDYNQSKEYQQWLSKVKFNGLDLKDAPQHIRNDINIVIAAIQNNSYSLEHASPNLRNDEMVIREAINQNGMILQHIPPSFRFDKTFVLRAVQKDGLALQFTSQEIQNDIQVVLAAVKQNGMAIQYVSSPKLQNDFDVVIAAVQQNGLALQFVTSPEHRSNKEIVLLAVQNNGLALEEAPPELRNDKTIVTAAIEQNGEALEYASPELRNDREIVLLAVQPKKSVEVSQQQAGAITAINERLCRSLEFASPTLRNDKEVVVRYVKLNPDNIKHAHEDIQRDPDVLIAAGMFDERHDLTRHQSRKIALSTRFSLTPSSHSHATRFTTLFKKSDYISSKSSENNNNFKIYAPNAFDKQTCDPDWTNFDWPCRGTTDTCQFDDLKRKTGHPTDQSCWRYSFRNQLLEAKKSGGFMLQLIEAEKWGKGIPQKLGNGQRIELDMAGTVGTKVFQVYRPTNDTIIDSERYELTFNKRHIDIVTNEISQWYNNKCQDMSVTTIRL